MDPQPIGQYIVSTSPGNAPQQGNYAASPPRGYYAASSGKKDSSGSNNALMALLIVLVVIAILYLTMRTSAGVYLGDALASCGWVLYTTPGCIYCDKQLAIFGRGSYPAQGVCMADPSGRMPDTPGPGMYSCSKIPAFPFWVNTKTAATRTGLQDLSQLDQMLRHPGS
jgi:hypothetical protein